MNKIKNLVIEGAAGKLITLDLFYSEEPGKKPVVIYAHGFNGFKDWGNFDLIATRFALAGFLLLKFNFSHNGTTPDDPEAFTDLEAFGHNNYTKQLEDLRAVTNWICAAENAYAPLIAHDCIYLIGHSMGGGIAVIYASEDARISKLVTWAAISECKTPWGGWSSQRMNEWKHSGVQYYTNARTGQQLPLYYQLYRDYEAHEERLNIKRAIKALKIPVLVCHGTLDISVPVEKAYQLIDWKPDAILFTVESNHVFDRQHPWIVTYLPEAMEEVLKETISFLK